MSQIKIRIPDDKLKAFCRRWKTVELSLFGSALREDFGSDSDVDVLIAFAPEARWGLLDHAEMEEELAAIFGREVELVSKRAVERSPNWIRRQEILSSARTIYAA